MFSVLTMAQPYDIVLWGCTGFTGTLVAEYFARDLAPKHPDLKWALCGRSKEKVVYATDYGSLTSTR